MSSFQVGFAFLPLIWAVNSIWFFHEAFRKPAYKEQKAVRTCKYNHSDLMNVLKWNEFIRFFFFTDVILSGVGALLWAIGLGIWITIFQASRAAWGEYADNISFIIPLGKA